MQMTILIPTYNEVKNIPSLLNSLSEVGKTNKEVNVNVIVIDDSSPDGTAMAANFTGRNLKTTSYKVTVLVRKKKEGLGQAYIYGFKFAMKLKNKPDYILQMDADLSHNPQ